jgi:hypothetical protein
MQPLNIHSDPQLLRTPNTEQATASVALSETQKKLAARQQQSAASVKSLEEKHIREASVLEQQHHRTLRKVLKFLNHLWGKQSSTMEALDEKHKREMQELEEQNTKEEETLVVQNEVHEIDEALDELLSLDRLVGRVLCQSVSSLIPTKEDVALQREQLSKLKESLIKQIS